MGFYGVYDRNKYSYRHIPYSLGGGDRMACKTDKKADAKPAAKPADKKADAKKPKK